MTDLGSSPGPERRNGWARCLVEDAAARAPNALVGGPFGSNLVSRDYVVAGVPVIRGQNMGPGRWVGGEFAFVSTAKAKELSANTARPGDLVFTQRGTLGQVALVPDGPYEKYIVSQSQMKLTVDPTRADAQFLYYVFTSREQQDYIANHAIQTGVPHTNLGILRRTPLRLPPLDEQRGITSILGALDDKIDLNRRMNRTLEAIAQALFKSWFVDFDPVHGNRDGRALEGISPHLQSRFPTALVEDGYGSAPHGWEFRRLGDFASLDKGLSYKGEFLAGSGIPMVNLGCFKAGAGFNEAGLKHYVGPYQPRHTIAEGDLVIANTDLTQNRRIIGSPAMVPRRYTQGPVLFTHHTFALRSDGRIPRAYLYLLLQQSAYRDRAQGFATGTTVLALPRDAVLDYYFAVPPFELTEAFNSIAEPLFARAEANEAEAASLANVRDTLLPKLLSGEVRVRDAERGLEAAT